MKLQNNWNDIIVTAITINNSQVEITKLYDKMIGWLIFTTRDEETSHDIFLKLIDKLNVFDAQRSNLHNFLYTVAVNEFKRLSRPKKKDLFFKEIPFSFFDISIDEKFLSNDIEIEIQEFEQKRYLKFDEAIEKLGADDTLFVKNYLHSKEKKTKSNHVKFYRLKNKLINFIDK